MKPETLFIGGAAGAVLMAVSKRARASTASSSAARLAAQQRQYDLRAPQYRQLLWDTELSSQPDFWI